MKPALIAAVAAVATAIAPVPAVAKAPAPLSTSTTPADIDSTYGSGHFGRWQVDQWGLPAYDYTDDELKDPDARQPELDGATAAQHQLGNDDIKGIAFNDGYTQLWSQALMAQWANLYQPADRHYAGGFGYLNVGGKIGSTLYADHPTDEQFQRAFGVGYYRKQATVAGVRVLEDTVAPFGNDPVLLDDVTLTNTTAKTLTASWFEYWDVNPYNQALGQTGTVGLSSPTWNPGTDTLSVGQLGGDPRNLHPLSIFAASLSGAPGDWDTSVNSFFGNGTRAAPAEVNADRLSETLARPDVPGLSGDTLFAFRAPATLRPGQSITLRYVYGMAHPAQIPALVARYRSAPGAERTSERTWKDYLPQGEFGPKYRWVSRELEWDAYLLRSSTVYEEDCGEHTITQGGYYEYGDGYNLGMRSWLHYELPILYSDRELAREILIYSIQFQPPGAAAGAQLPYGTGPFCERLDLGTSDDLDFWLLNAATEYGLATRDLAFFGRQAKYDEGVGTATVWDHLKLAFEHMETYLGPHGDYLMGATGDWNDFSTEFEQMTESTLVLAQLAYTYPRLAQLADLLGDRAFAAQVRTAASRDLTNLRAQRTAQGWYSRGYSATRQVGSGVIFEEPQPWAILAGAPTRAQAIKLVANIHRYLDGYGAPHGPTKIGTALVPGQSDPGVTEHGPIPSSSPVPGATIGNLLTNSPLQGADEWPGGVWFDPNGWLTWAYGTLGGEVPGAVDDAWSEYLRNTLANHATQFPDHWAGTISVDDVCYGYYSSHPASCGNGLSTSYDGEITEQPTWMVMDAIDLAGVTPVEDGYDITPHLPMKTFSLRDGDIGVAQRPRMLRGYITPVGSGPLVLHVALPPGTTRHDRVVAYANGHAVRATRAHGAVTFTLPATAGRAANWALAATKPSKRRR
jgi:hypothetical protein